MEVWCWGIDADAIVDGTAVAESADVIFKRLLFGALVVVFLRLIHLY